jgi:hypothetical protein
MQRPFGQEEKPGAALPQSWLTSLPLSISNMPLRFFGLQTSNFSTELPDLDKHITISLPAKLLKIKKNDGAQLPEARL